MKLETLLQKPLDSEIYLERYLNFGSVSKSSMLGELHQKYSATSPEESFKITGLWIPENKLFTCRITKYSYLSQAFYRNGCYLFIQAPF